MSRRTCRLPRSKASRHRLNHALIEALEDRQLLSLTIDLRTTGGGKSVTVNSPSEVINLQVWAVIAGNSDPSQNGVQDVEASFVSTNVGVGPIAGNLAAQNLAPFNGSGAQPGTPTDVNADGNLDVGGTDPNSLTGFFFARSDSLTLGANQFQIGTLTYTVTNLNSGGEVDVNFVNVPANPSTNQITALWSEHGFDVSNNFNGTVLTGAAVKIKDPALQPSGPIGSADNATALSGVAKVVDILANDSDTTGTIDPTTVKIVTPPNHGGTATIDPATGAITYTSAANFTGAETLSYTVKDNNGATSPATPVTFNVIQSGLTAAADSSNAFTGVTDTINVLANDTDINGTIDRTTLTIVSSPNHGGVATVDPSTGIISYTSPPGFTGSETLTYTVQDSNGATSAATLVTLTVTQPLKTAPDSASAATAFPTTINVLTNDTDASGTLNSTTVTIVVAPNHGGAATVNPNNGLITYTSAANFFGTETFSYTVKDSNGETSSPTLVTITVTPSLPVATNDTATARLSTAVQIPVLSNDGTAGVAVPSSVTISSQAISGTAIANSDGTITYTPSANFVGSDTFTYTFADAQGDVSNPATVTINIAVELSSAKGGNKSVTFTDGDATTATLTLNRGVTDVAFAGNGSATVSHGKMTIRGTNMTVDGVVLSGSTAATALTITGSGGDGIITIGQITDTGALGRIVAPVAKLTGVMNVGGLTTLQLASASAATITIGAAANPNLTIKSRSLANSTINAPAASLTLQIGPTTATNITALAGKSIRFTGDLTGAHMTFTTSAAAVNITGALSNSSLSFGVPSRGTVSLSHLSVAGAISNSTISATADITAITTASLNDSTITAGVATDANLTNATAANLGNNKIATLRLTSHGIAFSDSTILAHTIQSTSLGAVGTPAPQGLAAVVFHSLTAIVNSAPLRLSAKQLATQSAVGAVFSQLSITSADLDITVAG